MFDVGDTKVAKKLSTWISGVAPHVTLKQCVDGATIALQAGRNVLALKCNSCGCMHLDSIPDLGKRAIEHQCTQCSAVFWHAPAAVGNPLGVLHPMLIGGVLHVASMPIIAPPVGLASLAVEPNILGNLSRHV